MAGIVATLQSRMIDLVSKANAAELSAQNNRWQEMGATLAQIVDVVANTLEHLGGIDPTAANDAVDAVRLLHIHYDEHMASLGTVTGIDPGDPNDERGGVGTQPSIV